MDDQRTNRKSGGGTMQLPRVGIRSLLIVVAVLGLWLATFKMPDPTNRGIGIPLRLTIMLAILLSAGFAAIYHRGERQAFWCGFSSAMLLLLGRFFNFVPDVSLIARSWSGGLLRETDGDAFEMLQSSMWAFLIVSFSLIVGLIAAIIYAQSQTRK
jgi:hypothetical protein